MILHTIINPDEIIEAEADFSCGYSAVNGGFVEYEMHCGKKRVRRLYSTNPALYLKKGFCPYEKAD